MKELFPPTANPTADGYARQITQVIEDFGLHHRCHLHYRPNYVSGHPQSIGTPEIFGELAEIEQNAYQLATGGAYGTTAAAQAEAWGLGRICFISWRSGRHIYVYDVLLRTIQQGEGFYGLPGYLQKIHRVRK